MRIGIQLVQVASTDPARLVAFARAVEQEGYTSLWVADRLLHGTHDEDVPTLDPFALVGFLAAATERMRLGTSVVVAPRYPPTLLARALTSLDWLTSQRFVAGLGLGRAAHERSLVNGSGPSSVTPGRRLDAALDALEKVGRVDGLRAGPRPRVLLAASTPAGLDRIARRADGWHPAGLAPEAIGPMWHAIRELASGYGRDADTLELVVRADVTLTDAPLAAGRAPLSGSLDQVACDLEAIERAGADEVVLRLMGGPTDPFEVLGCCGELAEAAGLRVARA